MLRLQFLKYARPGGFQKITPKRRIIPTTKSPPMPKAGPETSKTIKRSEVWWIKLTKLYQATPIYKIPKWTLSKINNLPPYVDKSTLGILVFTSLVFAGVYGQNEYVYQTQAKLHTENNYPFDALKVIESDMRLKYAFGGEVIFDGITKNAVSEYDEDPVDHTVCSKILDVSEIWSFLRFFE